MSTLALSPGEIAALPAEKMPRPGFLQRLVAARKQQALGLIANHLAAETHQHLSDLGLTGDEINALRRAAHKWSSR